MKKTIGIIGTLGVLGSCVALAAPASARTLPIGDGEAVVLLPKCGDDNAKGQDKYSQSNTYVPDCSYTYFVKKIAPSYTYLASQGAISWNGGSITGGALQFPAGGQTWPKLSDLYLNASSAATANPISGSVDLQTGKVELTVSYATTLTAGSSVCTLTGTAELSSDATEGLGGQATGKAYDPQTGTFAVATKTASTPTKSGSCATLDLAYDLSKGMGWYLTGQIGLPGGKEPVVPDDNGGAGLEVQNATVATPKKIKGKGKTVILTKAVTTNAGQKATSKLTWSTKKSAKGTSKKFASAKTTKAGKLTLTTTGKAKKLYVKLVSKAPATKDFQAFSYTKTWVVKQPS